MKYLLKRSVCLAGKDYARGLRDLPPGALADPYLTVLVKTGLAKEADSIDLAAAVSVSEKKAKLAEKLTKPKPVARPVITASKSIDELKAENVEAEERAELARMETEEAAELAKMEAEEKAAAKEPKEKKTKKQGGN